MNSTSVNHALGWVEIFLILIGAVVLLGVFGYGYWWCARHLGVVSFVSIYTGTTLLWGFAKAFHNELKKKKT